MDARTVKGMEIAATAPLQRDTRGWLVPSQRGMGFYRVSPHPTTTYKVAQGLVPPPNGVQPWSCDCPDFELRQLPCKHVLAVQFTIRRETVNLDGSVVTEEIKVTYSQPWSAYNAAQCVEKDRFLVLLADLCSAIPQPARARRGRPPMSTSDMAFATVYKVYSRFSSRRFTSDLRDAENRGLIAYAPHFNTVSNYLSNPNLTPVLAGLITASALPLRAVETDFAVDSTGFGTSRFVRWYSKKYGQEVDNREWIKLHAMCGVRTHIVTAATVTGWTAHDTTFFRPLLETTAENFTIGDVTADKAYLSHANVDAVEKFGGTPFIPFKINSVEPTGDGAWERMYHAFSYNRDAFLARYHQRSNVETVFSMCKAKFGDSVLSKSDTGQMNEALCKIVAHNICVIIRASQELGIVPAFRAESAGAHQMPA